MSISDFVFIVVLQFAAVFVSVLFSGGLVLLGIAIHEQRDYEKADADFLAWFHKKKRAAHKKLAKLLLKSKRVQVWIKEV